MEENIICSDDNIERSLSFLTEALMWKSVPLMLTYDCFVAPSEHESQIDHDWKQAVNISRNEFNAQIHYELGMFYFYKENYDMARTHFKSAVECFKQIDENVGFVSVKLGSLEGYLLACTQMEESNKRLLYLLSVSIANQYTVSIILFKTTDTSTKLIP